MWRASSMTAIVRNLCTRKKQNQGSISHIPFTVKWKWLLLAVVVSNKQCTPENWGLPGEEPAGSLQPLTLPDSLRNPTSTHQALICAAQWTPEHTAWSNGLLRVSIGNQKMKKTNQESLFTKYVCGLVITFPPPPTYKTSNPAAWTGTKRFSESIWLL